MHPNMYSIHTSPNFRKRDIILNIMSHKILIYRKDVPHSMVKQYHKEFS